MGPTIDHSSVWRLAAKQHGRVARRQLLARGLSSDAIRHRLARGRLHPTRYRGVYAVGRTDDHRHGQLMEATLACGAGAGLAGESAAALWRIRPDRPGPITVAIPAHRRVRQPGVTVQRRVNLAGHLATLHGIPVTTPIRTLIDIATTLEPRKLEAAINEADRLNLVDPDGLAAAVDERRGVPGAARLRRLLDRATFSLTDSELERAFIPLAARAGLPRPLTQQMLHGLRVDFHWPELGLVVETDGLRYHRTPVQQSRDRLRDQMLTAAGLTVLRFTHAQVRFEPAFVVAALRRVAARLAARARSTPRG